MQHWSGLLEGSLSLFWNRRLATILAVLPRDEQSRSLVRNSGPIFLLRYRFSFISLLDQVSWSSSGMLSTRISFLRLWFSRNSILLSLTSFNDLQKCLRFIRNLSHGVRSLKLVTFIKTYLEYNQLQLQTLDITKFCISQSKLRHYHNHHHQMVLFLD